MMDDKSTNTDERVEVACHACTRCLFGPNPLVTESLVEEFRQFAAMACSDGDFPLLCHRSESRGIQIGCALWWQLYGEEWQRLNPQVSVKVVPLPERDPDHDAAEFTDRETGQGAHPRGTAILEHVRIKTSRGILEWLPEQKELRRR